MSQEWQIYRISDFEGFMVIFWGSECFSLLFDYDEIADSMFDKIKYESFHVSMELNYDNKYKYIGKCYKSYQKYASFKWKFCCFVLDNFFFSSGKVEVEVEETS